jgi:PLP dependent protein
MSTMDRLEDRYAQVMREIPDHVKLIAVSKKRTLQEIKALYDLGHRRFGESYPQELRDKHPLLPQDIEWHFIGNLQSNKVKYIAPVASLVHTVDGAAILDQLEKRVSAAGRRLPVLYQVHIAREETKHGMDPQEVDDLLKEHSRWPSLVPTGLMGMATNTDDQEQVRHEFRGLKALFDRIQRDLGSSLPHFKELSMGMSDDAPLAIAEGSTMVRIGTAIFGERST